MNLSTKDAIYAAGLGAVVGAAYTIGRAAWWGTGTLNDITTPELLMNACVGAIAGMLAFALRRSL
jgi:hypothetical protein